VDEGVAATPPRYSVARDETVPLRAEPNLLTKDEPEPRVKKMPGEAGLGFRVHQDHRVPRKGQRTAWGSRFTSVSSVAARAALAFSSSGSRGRCKRTVWAYLTGAPAGRREPISDQPGGFRPARVCASWARSSRRPCTPKGMSGVLRLGCWRRPTPASIAGQFLEQGYCAVGERRRQGQCRRRVHDTVDHHDPFDEVLEPRLIQRCHPD
jgi:hypothetical protein